MQDRPASFLASLPVSGRGESLAQRIAATLRDAIRRDAMAPGTALPTAKALCAHFGVSRPVVREAMAILAHEGWVITRQGSGVYVAGPSPADAARGAARNPTLDLVELRRAIEVEAAGLAALRRDGEDLARIHTALATLDGRNDADVEAVKEGFAFHRALLLAAHNPSLVAVVDQLTPYLEGTMRVMRGNRARRLEFTRAVKREHHAIVEAIEAGDAHRARAAALSHFDASEARIRGTDRAVWAESPDGEPPADPTPRARSLAASREKAAGAPPKRKISDRRTR